MKAPADRDALEKTLSTLPDSCEPAAQLLMPGRGPFIIYGAGSNGRDAAALLAAEGFEVWCFLDRKAQPGDRCGGIPVFPLESQAIPGKMKKNATVVVAVFNAFVEIAPIVDSLRTAGYRNIVDFLQFHRLFHAKLGNRFWLTSPSYYLDKVTSILAAFDLWEDELSRRLYAAFLAARLASDINMIPTPRGSGPQYFAAGIPRLKSPIMLVDCGAYDGDTIRDLVQHYGSLDRVMAFEPDPGNFSKLRKSVVNLLNVHVKEAVLLPCGVWSQTKQLRFSTGLGMASGITTTGDSIIQCVALDDVLGAVPSTLIKMDLEGAEYQALLGARETIRACQPMLAVCLYHTPEHLWQLPMLVKHWVPNYRCYLRVHWFNGFEVVLYACPGRE